MPCRHLNQRMWLSEIDLDAAYRRLHVKPNWMVTSCSVVDDIVFILSRVPFGVLAGPSKFFTVCEAVFDLIYDLLIDKTWDPDTLRVEGWDHLIYGSEQTNKEKLNKANKLMVKLPDINYMCDGYIDGGIMFGLEQNAV